MITINQFKEIKNKIYGVMDKLDPTGINLKYYKSIFDNMSLQSADKYFKKFLEDDTANFTLTVQAYVNDLKMNNIKKAAEFLRIPLFERVALKYRNQNKEVYYTSYKVPVMYVHVKRVEQMTSKKNSMSIDIQKRNTKTGQVTGDSKNARMSDMENIALVTLGSDAIMKEFLGPKADDLNMKMDMHKQIKNNGVVYIDELRSTPKNKTAINTLDVFFTSCGIKTDLITDGLLLKRTLSNLNRDNTGLANKIKEM